MIWKSQMLALLDPWHPSAAFAEKSGLDGHYVALMNRIYSKPFSNFVHFFIIKYSPYLICQSFSCNEHLRSEHDADRVRDSLADVESTGLGGPADPKNCKNKINLLYYTINIWMSLCTILGTYFALTSNNGTVWAKKSLAVLFTNLKTDI